MTLNQLFYFTTLAKTLNFHKASEQLNMSQPALSISISRLEEELGLFLFKREGRKVELTKSGTIYLKMIREVLDSLEAANSKIKRYAAQNSGHINLGYSGFLSRQFIPRNIRDFMAETPSRSTTFSLREAATMFLVQGLKSQQHDVIFCPFIPNHPEIQFIPVLEQEIAAIVAEGHPLSERGVIDLSELAPYPFVHYMEHSGLRREIDTLISRSGWTPRVVCDATDEIGIATMVAMGYGVSCVACVEALEQCGGIKKIPINMPECRRIIYLGFLKGIYLTPAVQDFIKFMSRRRLTLPGGYAPLERDIF